MSLTEPNRNDSKQNRKVMSCQNQNETQNKTLETEAKTGTNDAISFVMSGQVETTPSFRNPLELNDKIDDEDLSLETKSEKFTELEKCSSVTDDLYRKGLFQSETSIEELGHENLGGSTAAEEVQPEDQDSNVGEQSVSTLTRESSSSCDDSYMGRADIFRPILTDEERKMLGIACIPTFPSAAISIKPSSDFLNKEVPGPRIGSGLIPSSALGAGDAHQGCSKTRLEKDNFSLTSSIAQVDAGQEKDGMVEAQERKPKRKGRAEKRVCFSVSEDPTDGNFNIGSRSSKIICNPVLRFGQTRKMGSGRINGRVSTATYKEPTTTVALMKDSSKSDNEGHSFFSKTDTFNRFVRSLSVQSLKSKKLETKLKQDMRVAFFDLEAQRASEDWKFRKSVEALDLEYQKKLVNLVESHNGFQKKIQDRFLKQVRKTEKRLKKEALHGRLNEGNCFSVSNAIETFIKDNN